MSVFSQMLKKYTNRSNMTIVSMAKQCGIDRATLHKIISGERKPPNRDVVKKLCRLLMLSAEEREKLLEQYTISLMGDEVYHRRKSVQQMFRTLSLRSKDNEHAFPFSFDTSADIGGLNDITVCESTSKLLQALSAVMISELSGGSDIFIIAQPNNDFCRFIRSVFPNTHNGRIVHIFCADNSASCSEANDYNLEFFPSVCDLAFSCKGYSPRYYYDNVSAHINSATLLPVLFVTDNYAICAENGLCSGIIYRDPAAVDYYRARLYALNEHCEPFITTEIHPLELLVKNINSTVHKLTFDNSPCLFILGRDAPSIKALNLPEQEKKLMFEYTDIVRERCIATNYIDVFSEAGLREYILTGRIPELPDYKYTPASFENRLVTLRKMIEVTESGQYGYRIISDKYTVSNAFRINLKDDGTIKLVMRSNGEHLFFTICEQSILCAINDYIEYLFESGIIFSKERTVEIMRAVLKEASELGT